MPEQVAVATFITEDSQYQYSDNFSWNVICMKEAPDISRRGISKVCWRVCNGTSVEVQFKMVQISFLKLKTDFTLIITKIFRSYDLIMKGIQVLLDNEIVIFRRDGDIICETCITYWNFRRPISMSFSQHL